MDATVELLRALAAACRAGSMATAAKALTVDKATISRRLAALEQTRPGLFERRAGRITPTAAGARALEALTEVELGVARLHAELDSGSASAHGMVRLTTPAFLATAVVVPALPRFLAQHPEVDLALLATSRMVDVARGETDLAVRNVAPSVAGLVSRRVSRIALALFASRTYLARRGPVVHGSLDGHDFLDYEFGTIGGPGLEWLPAAVARTRVVFRGDDADLVAVATHAGLGVAALPRLLGDADPDLVQVLPDQLVAPVFVVVRDELRRLARVRAVVTWISDLIAATTPRLAPS